MPFFGVPIRNGLPIGLGSVAGFGAPQEFSPSELFLGGTAGAWYDPSDLTTLFTTSAGTTPVAMPGGGAAVSVGRMLDKSGNGNHAIAFNDTTARPELRARVNLLVATATLSTQSVTTQATSYTLSFAGTGSITLSGTATGSYSAGTHTITCTAGTLTLTVSGTVTTADLRPANSGALLPAYQAVVDANTYDTSGFPLYLRFDGVDDSMYTPANLNLSGTDKVAVFAGVRKLSDAGYQVITSNGVPTTENRRFAFFSTYNASGDYAYQLAGSSFTTLGAAETTTQFAAPRTDVTTSEISISVTPITSAIQLRVNQANQALSQLLAYSTSATTFADASLQIGRRSDNNFFLNGQVYGLLIVGSAVSAGNIGATEQWVAGKTGIVIP